MNTEPNHDEAIDKVLAALRRAAPPEGLETRIASRIARESASPAPARRRLPSLAPSAAWWRGAIAGAAAATLRLSATALVQHGSKAARRMPHDAERISVGQQQITPASLSPNTAQVTGSHSAPCPTPAIRRVRTDIPASTPPSPHYASFAPSHPLPVLPPTTQERELLQVARTADPKMLASVNPESQAKLEAEDREQFNKFFAAPPSTNANQ